MTGSLLYEVTASGRRVALCVDKADAEEVARHWYDGQVRELSSVFIMAEPPVQPGFTYTYTPQPVGEAKRKEDTETEEALPYARPICPRCGVRYNPTLTAGTCH